MNCLRLSAGFVSTLIVAASALAQEQIDKADARAKGSATIAKLAVRAALSAKPR